MTDQQEREANYFAMCLLMPEAMLRRDVEEIRSEGKRLELEQVVDALAERYKVSVAHMTLRLGQLGLVCSW